MRILVATQVFPPEAHPTAVMVAELAAELAAQGSEVGVAAGYPHHPHGKLLGGYRKQLLLRERRGAFDVVRAWHLTTERMTLAARAAVMGSQALAIAGAALAWRKPSVIVSYGPPLVGPLLLGGIGLLRGARHISVVYDLYPDVVIDSGALRNPLLVRAARLLERLSYRISDRVVVLSDGFRRALEARGVASDKIAVVPVWLDPDELKPASRDNAWRREQRIPLEQKVVLYAGTIGLVSGARVVLDAADRLRDRPDILFLLVGEGRLKDELEAEAARRGLPNVRFLGFQPRGRLREVQATADLSLVTLAPGRGRTSVPSKVVGYLAAGRPVLASVDLDSDTAEAIRAGGCGALVEPGRADLLASSVRTMLDDPGLPALGEAGRAFFLRTYSKDAVIAAMRAVIEGVEVRGTA